MKLKNVVIINDFNYVQGGATKVAIDTARILRDNKLNVYFFYATNSKENKIEGVHYVCTNQNEALKEKNKIKGALNGLYNVKARKKLERLLEELDPDETIIHVHGWTKSLSSSIFDIAFKMKFNVVLTFHDYFFACPNGGFFNYKENKICNLEPLSFGCIKCNCDSRNIIFKVYRIIRQFIQNKIVKVPKKIENAIVISDFSEKVLKKYFRKDLNVCKIYNPINIKALNTKKYIKEKDYFLFVGRIDKEKGIENFCNIIQETKQKGIVIGTGKLKEELEKKYKNIKFTGWKDSEEVYLYMKNAKALVFPSLWYETAGLTVLEAQTLNTPCIVNECTAATEFVTPKTGIIYKDENELYNIIKNFDTYNFDFENFDCNKYSYITYMNKIINFYNEILESEKKNERFKN